jgi:hypothetical protein
MKRHLILFFFTLFSASLVHAQTRDLHTGRVITNWTGIPASASVDETREIIQDIISVIGLKPDFEVRAANISNAAAVLYNGKRFVLYNPQFISRLNAAAGNKWAAVSVLAHEIGHHLNGHTLKNLGSQPNLELEADEFSGFVLRRMGATLPQSQAAMKLASDYKQSLTHPGQKDRLFAIARGWNNADGQGSGKDLAKYDRPVVDQRVATDKSTDQPVARKASVPTLDEQHILGDVYFNGDRNSRYYITVRYNLVRVVNDKLYLVGKVSRTNSNKIPYVISSKGLMLYVDRYGKILTASGNVAGIMRQHFGYK